MRKYFFTRIIIAFFIVLLLILLAIFFANVFLHSPTIGNVATGINHYRGVLTLVRVGFYFLFFALWPKVVNWRAKKYHWPAENIPKAARLRYPILMFFLILEALGQFGPVAGG